MGRLFDKVIECEAGNDVVVWRSPQERFNPPLKLVVKGSQEAIFTLNGQALDSFGPGSHELDLPELPLLLSALGVSNEKINSFRADVYFFNLIDIHGIKWGTESRLQYMDPVTNELVSIGALGTFSLTVKRPKMLLDKYVGTSAVVSKNDLATSARSQLQMKIKTLLLKQIKEKSIGVYDLEMYLDELSDAGKERLAPFFSQYGIELSDFVIEKITSSMGESDNSRNDEGVYNHSHTGSADGQRFCPQCRYLFTAGERFCPQCGRRR